MRTFVAAAAALVVSATSVSAQGVRLENGNFHVNYTDLRDPIGFTIDRSYNSKSNIRSMFGWGWGTPHDTHLTLFPDGSILLQEYGVAFNRFYREFYEQPPVEPTVGLLIDAAREARAVIVDADVENLRRRLTRDTEFRETEWRRYLRHGLVTLQLCAEGTEFFNGSGQTILCAGGQYIRRRSAGQRDTFDREGRLIRTSGGAGAIQLAYDSRGLLSSITGSNGRSAKFLLNDRGLLERVEGSDGRAASYRYNSLDQLVFAHDADGVQFTYEYDHRHNLTRIGYQDGTWRGIAYHPLSVSEDVRAHRFPDGTRFEYAQTWDHINKALKTIWTTRFDPDGTLTDKILNRYVREDQRVSSAGQASFTFEAGRITGGVSEDQRFEVTYDPSGRPIELNLLRIAGQLFEYDSSGACTTQTFGDAPSIGSLRRLLTEAGLSINCN